MAEKCYVLTLCWVGADGRSWEEEDYIYNNDYEEALYRATSEIGNPKCCAYRITLHLSEVVDSVTKPTSAWLNKDLSLNG